MTESPPDTNLGSRLRDWFLLDADRTALAAGFLLVALAVFGWLEFVGLLRPDQMSSALLYLFGALAGGNITLVTIVISINQLVLSRELRSPRELEREVEAAESFRGDVEDATRLDVVPAQPKEFLLALVENTLGMTWALQDAVDDGSTDFDGEIDTLCSNVQETLEQAKASLEGSGGSTFEALATILHADFSTWIAHGRWIRHAFEGDLSAETGDALSDLEDTLTYLDIARQYFKTLHIQQELAGLSRRVTYAGFVAELVALSSLIYAGFLDVPGQVYDLPYLLPLAITVALAPLALLIAHVLRIATVAFRTAAITPFVSPT